MKGVSIVICCFNGEKIIEETLSYLQKQLTSYPWEVILVDNASTDNTALIAKKQWELNKITELIIIKESNPGLLFARKTGVENSKYDVISFVDDDNFVPENWINKIFETFENPIVGILGVTAIGLFENPPPEWYEDFKDSFATGELYDFSGNVNHHGCVYGAGMSVRKKIYDDLKLKNWSSMLLGRVGKIQTGGDDTEICLAAKILGYEVHYSKEIKIKHKINNDRFNLERLFNMTVGFGMADVLLLPYEIMVRKKFNTSQPLDFLRKSVAVNLSLKKSKLAYLFLKHKIGMLSSLQYKIQSSRNKAFCDTIINNKKGFYAAFNAAENLAIN